MKSIKPVIIGLLFALFVVGTLPAQESTDENAIASVRVEGNKRIATETYLYYISAKPGATYDDRVLRDDFKRLWQTGFLDDLKIDIEKVPGGIDVIYRVTERPLLKSIEYTGNKKVNTSDIETKLKDTGISLRIDQPFDPFAARRVTNAIEKLMIEKGLQFGSAQYKTEPIGDSNVKLTFVVDEGPNVKIGDIQFEGNTVFDDGKLRKTMKETKTHWMFSWISKKDDFEKEKFEKDMDLIRDIYYDRGYINARVDEPVIALLENKKRMKITIPINEGNQFTTGNVTFSGNTVFPSAQLLPFIPLQKGKVFNRSLLKKGLEEIQTLYGNRGYIYASLGPVFDPKDEEKIINLNVEVEENGEYYVRRIEFTGNNYTRDKVVRREMLLQEGDLLRVSKFKDSMDRIYRLGFFDDLKPNITPVPEEKNQADISVDVKENKRNEIRLGGGYSQLEGFFGDLVFSTKNLFGSGKIFTVQIQSGSRSKNYAFDIVEPYFMDRRLALGFSVYRSRQDFFTLLTDRTGATISMGFPLFEEVKASLAYGYQIVDITNRTGTVVPVDPNLFPGFDLQQKDHSESRFIPQIIRSTINNPIDPSRGSRLIGGTQFVGGFLGGDLDYYKPTVTYTRYLPGLTRRQFTAFNIEMGYGSGFSGQELPFVERYFLGGEYSIRGYELRSVGPVEETEVVDVTTGIKSISRFNAGGNKFFQLNAEYVIPLAGPLKIAGFLDYGNAFAQGDGIDFTDMRGSTGLELRMVAPFLSTPFRFIYAFNFNRGDLLTLTSESLRPKRTIFRFSVGTTF